MCGIIGVKTEEDAATKVFNGLKRLEYRGYDSAGIACVENSSLKLQKGVGTIEEVVDQTEGGDTAVGHCLHPETLVVDSTGKVVEIQDLNSEKVQSFHFEDYRESNQQYRKYRHESPEKLYEIKGPYSRFKATSKHKLFVAENGKIKEKEVGNLNGDELIAAPSKIPHKPGKRPSFTEVEQTKKYKDLEFPEEPSRELLQIIGYHIGDGFISGNRTLRYKDARKDVLEYYNQLFKKVFNISGNIHGRKEGHYVLNVNSKYLVDWFEQNMSSALGKTGEEEIPKLVYDCDLYEIGGLVSGLFDAEGTVGVKAKQVSLTMTNGRLVKELRQILLKKEILSTLSEEKKTQENWSNAYTLSLNSKEAIKKFILWAGFTTSDKKEKIREFLGDMDGRTYKHSSVPKEQQDINIDYKSKTKGSLLTDERLQTILKTRESEENEQKLDSNIIWTRFSVEEKDSNTDQVYDLEVDITSSFYAGGAVQHNSRWATHGGVTDQNAHPHTDCENEIAVVHNGIIQNYEALKRELKQKGHEFRSETDTEVIPHLLEEYYKENSAKEACEKAVERLEGSYAIAAAFPDGDIIGFKKDSPLVVGVSEEDYFLASDITAFIDYTDQAIFLEDGDLAVLNSDLKVFRDGEEIEVETEEIKWNAEQASKAGYDHYMEKEIHEQPTTVKRAAFQDRSDLKEAVGMLDNAENIYITGCGTASYAAALGAKYLRKAGYKVDFEQAHELEYRTDEIGEDDVVIAVSQSGETADLLATLKQQDADTLAIVNVVGSTLARKAKHKLFVNAGPEIGVASTKAFTGQVTVLRLLGYAAENRIDEGRQNLVEVAEEVETVIEENKKVIGEISDYLLDKDDVYFIGRDKGREMALESALKLKELSYIHAEGFPGGEFKHGTLALIEENVPVFAFLNHHGEEILSNGIEARSRGADLIGVGANRQESFEYFVEVPDFKDSEILEIIPFQMLAYQTSVKKGNNPDKPRNLAKSVTVK